MEASTRNIAIAVIGMAVVGFATFVMLKNSKSLAKEEKKAKVETVPTQKLV